jgi:hypothetical protein
MGLYLFSGLERARWEAWGDLAMGHHGWRMVLYVSVLRDTDSHACANDRLFNSYDSRAVGTFPNQMLKDKSRSASAFHSDASNAKYTFELSVLSGQRLS